MIVFAAATGLRPSELFALEQGPGTEPLLFPNARGGHLDFRNFNRRHWKPVEKTVGSSRCATLSGSV